MKFPRKSALKILFLPVSAALLLMAGGCSGDDPCQTGRNVNPVDVAACNRGNTVACARVLAAEDDCDSTGVVLPSPADGDIDNDGHYAGSDDCDDTDPSVYKNAPEVCDGKDNNCDDVIDEGYTSTMWYPDTDHDGYGDPAKGVQGCEAPLEHVLNSDDCDDTDDTVNPIGTEVAYDGIDQNCDGDDLTDVDLDGYDSVEVPGGTYCDDIDAKTYPGHPEFEDDKDNNCDGGIDNGLNTNDDDGDGFSEAEGDCLDSDTTIHPDATEVAYDGIDQDCSGRDLTDVDLDGYDSVDADGGTDCNDANAEVNPSASEICNDMDDNCDGNVDRGAVDAQTWYPDRDQDGYGSGSGAKSCSPIEEYVSTTGDCDDANAEIHPDAAETCDSIDQDCDGETDEGETEDSVTFYADVDQDGYGNAESTKLACSAPAGYVVDATDCNDFDQNTHVGAAEIADEKDNDCDGEIDEEIDATDDDGDGFSEEQADCNDNDAEVYPGATEIPYDGKDQDCDGVDLIDADVDGYTSVEVGGADCDDANDTIHPNATEICDEIDQDCDGLVDEEATGTLTYYADTDGDGFGDPNTAVESCTAPAGNVRNNTDCNDAEPTVYPGAVEYADDLDNNCNGSVDEGLDTTDDDKDGYSETQGDCNDADRTIHPGATDIPYDYVDQDCQGGDLNDLDGDGVIASKVGGADCNDADATIYPGAEEVPYDGIDQNCNGEDLEDVDGDGYAAEDVGGTDCYDTDMFIYPGAPEVAYDGIDQDCDGQDLDDLDYDGYAGNGGPDCNDSNGSIHPGATETCDSVDQDCDGLVDDNAANAVTYYADVDHDGYGDPDTATKVCTAPSGYITNSSDCDDSNAAVHPGATETCDGVDQDCNGVTDYTTTALLYSAATDTVSVPTATALNMGTTGTIEAWIWWRGTAGQVLTKWTKSLEDKAMAINSDGTVTVYFVTATGTMTLKTSTSLALQVNKWTHVAFSWNTSKLYGWVNGKAAGESTTVGDPKDSTGGLYLGGVYRDSAQAAPALMALSDVRVSGTARYTTSFTPASKLTADSNTKALWNLDEGTGTVATEDITSLNGTISGAVWTGVSSCH